MSDLLSDDELSLSKEDIAQMIRDLVDESLFLIMQDGVLLPHEEDMETEIEDLIDEALVNWKDNLLQRVMDVVKPMLEARFRVMLNHEIDGLTE